MERIVRGPRAYGRGGALSAWPASSRSLSASTVESLANVSQNCGASCVRACGRSGAGAKGRESAERTSTAELLIMNRSSTPSVVVIAPADEPLSAAATGAFTSSTGVSSTCSTRIDVVAPVIHGSSLSDGSATEPKCLSSRLRSR